MATHSSTLAWKIPWMEEHGRLQSMWLQTRTRLNNFAFAFRTVIAVLLRTFQQNLDFKCFRSLSPCLCFYVSCLDFFLWFKKTPISFPHFAPTCTIRDGSYVLGSGLGQHVDLLSFWFGFLQIIQLERVCGKFAFGTQYPELQSTLLYRSELQVFRGYNCFSLVHSISLLFAKVLGGSDEEIGRELLYSIFMAFFVYYLY